ncbi:hypothetical protein E1263_01765 [Kribbella antibiotica]|uniref:MucR family transcriptional regulator n=1 Tax=Kribbella antibiotica TaxID=190195 RepID=A0A4R4ZWV7_9ACTN|nr:hypothetical protein [Kribbella antibiotica]TDD63060.1 hypothetical protein E1263_01765 [Kribbella antibiotica]
MSSLLHPVGHLPASVYWFRRGLVLFVLLVLFFLIFQLFPGGDDPKKSAAVNDPQKTQTPPPSDKPSKTPTPTPKPSDKPTGKPSETPSKTPQDVKCSGSNAKVEVLPAVRKVASGATLNFVVRLDAVSDECKATVDPDSLTVSVTSGADLIWTTSHCGQAIPKATLVVAKGKDAVSTVVWNGHRSGPGCLPGQPVAKPGTYVVKAEFSGQASPAQAFTIS